MYQLPADQFTAVRPLFDGIHLALIIEGMIAGNSPALIWVDDPCRPRAAYGWDKFHSHYLVGAADNLAFNHEISQLIRDHLLPTVPPPVYVTVDYTPGWEDQIAGVFPAVALQKYPRVFLTLKEFKDPDWRSRIPDGFTLRPLDAALLADSTLRHVEAVIAEIRQCWTSVEHFLANGSGFCLVHDRENEIAGWCTSEFRSAGRCGIGIETVEAYQNRGFATLTAAALVERCRADNLAPHWDSWARNLPSVRVAEKIGFQKAVAYSAYVGVYEQQTGQDST